MKRRHKIVKRIGGGALPLVFTTVVMLVLLVFALSGVRGWFGAAESRDPLVVYCAAGVTPAVEQVARHYEAEFGIPVEVRSGSSGALESQIRASKNLRSGDLYIPAAEEPFVARNRVGTDASRESGTEPFLAEVIPLARFRLALAVTPDNPKNIGSLDDLLKPGVSFLVANDQAAVGKKTQEVLAAAGRWKALAAAATRVLTVTEATSMIEIGTKADAGFVWDTNARQRGLEIVPVAELTAAPATISAGVITTSTNPTGALRFARYLAAPEKGQQVFAEHHYETVNGDSWAKTPEIVLFSGGVNREAVKDTIVEFERREGCTVVPTFDGCGALVATMRSGTNPDAYFACDVSFLTQVQDRFDDGVELTNTDMVMLVHKGNPKKIEKLEDLTREGLAVGVADEKLSALGRLTADLLKERGIYDGVVKNRKASSPTAHFLVMQLVESDKLDAAIVYRANCYHILEQQQADIVPIDHERANAIQPFAIHRQAKYPQLTQRLQDALITAKSRERFQKLGFRWQLDKKKQADQ